MAERPRVADERRALAFGALVDSYLAGAYRLATTLLRDPAEAEDATEEALLRAWSSWAQLRDSERAEAWFQGILVNECRERLRLRGRRLKEIVGAPEGAARVPIGSWRGRLILGLAARYLPPVLASAIVMTRTDDLERIRDSAAGAKLRVGMTPHRQLARLVGDTVIAVGAWRHRPGLLAAGAMIIGLARASAFEDQAQPSDRAALNSPWEAGRHRIRV